MSRHWAERIGWVVLVVSITTYFYTEYSRLEYTLDYTRLYYTTLKRDYDKLYKGSEKEAEDLRHANWKPLKTPRTD